MISSRRVVPLVIATVLATSGLGAVAPVASAAASCTPAVLIVARGTFEPGTLGVVVGDRIADSLDSLAPGTFSYRALDYPANTDSSSPRVGNTALVAAVTSAARACPRQRIVLSGYSQGAQVVDQAIGIDTTGTINGGAPTAVIPTALRSRVAAVVQFGNPIGQLGKHVTGTYASRTKEFCADGDPVCQPGGANVLAHLSYFLNADAAARFILERT